jgi:hypothetical protein
MHRGHHRVYCGTLLLFNHQYRVGILIVLGLVALALLAFAPAFSLSIALLVFAYRIGMTKLVPWLREVRQPRQASPVDEWVSPVVDEWVSPVRRPQPQSRQTPCGRELVVYEGDAQALSPKAGQIDPWVIWAVVGSMMVMFVGLVIASHISVAAGGCFARVAIRSNARTPPRAQTMTSRRKTGRAQIEERANTNEAKKPWLKLEMSRRTWYRRQAEQRKGRE